MEFLADRLHFARKRAKLSQAKLAELSGLQQSDVSKIENGRIKKTTALPALARVLRCDTHWGCRSLFVDEACYQKRGLWRSTKEKALEIWEWTRAKK